MHISSCVPRNATQTKKNISYEKEPLLRNILKTVCRLGAFTLIVCTYRSKLKKSIMNCRIFVISTRYIKHSKYQKMLTKQSDSDKSEVVKTFFLFIHYLSAPNCASNPFHSHNTPLSNIETEFLSAQEAIN